MKLVLTANLLLRRIFLNADEHLADTGPIPGANRAQANRK